MKTFGYTESSYRFWREGVSSLSNVFVCVNVFAFLTLSLLNWFHWLSWQQAYGLFGVSRFGILERHWFFQFITSPFLHGSVTHLAFNMLSLWMLGPSIERAVGRKRFLLLSVLCTMSASAGFLLLSPGKGPILMGYAGIIFGILVAQAMLFPNSVLVVFGFFPLKMKHAVVLLGAVELYLTLTSQNGTTAHAAHVMGALFSFAYLSFLRLRAKREVRGFEETKIPAAKQIGNRYKSGIPHEL